MCYKIGMEPQEKFEEIVENVFAIHDDTYPLYIVKGEKNFLIDSGILPRARQFHRNIETVLPGEKIDTLLLTHSHYDHLGTASYLQNIYEFDVRCSHQAAELLNSPDMVEMIDYRNQEAKQKFNDRSKTRFETLKNVQGVAEGDRIRVDANRFFEVIAVPGHSDCAVAYLLLPEKILFAGDAAGMKDHNGFIWPVFFSNYDQYEKSLARMDKIEAEALACGHARLIKGKENVQAYFKEATATTRRLKMEIIGKLHRGEEAMIIAESIQEKRFIPNSVLGEGEDFVMNVFAIVNTVSNALGPQG